MAKIMFQLDCLARRDEDAKVYVGYIPALNLFTQASSEERLPKALHSAALQYLTACHKRRLLDSVMERCGFKTSPETDMNATKVAGREFVAVAEEIAEEMPQYDWKLSVDVAMPLAA